MCHSQESLAFVGLVCFLVSVHLYVLEFCMMSIFNELVHIFIKRPPLDVGFSRCVEDPLVTHSAVIYSLVVLLSPDIFPISILNFKGVCNVYKVL